MDIDQRLERLAERHEALTQTVEHLARQGEEQNQRIDKLTSGVAAHEREMERFRRAMRAALQAWLGENGTEPQS